MNLTETPEYLTWPETHYVFVERMGPFRTSAPEAWGQAHSLLPALAKPVKGYMSLYKPGPQVYRAGFALETAPGLVPEGLQYELFPGGKYARFVLTGPYGLLGPASARVFEIVSRDQIPVRDDFYIENYVKDPRVTPAEQLVTEILVPTA